MNEEIENKNLEMDSDKKETPNPPIEVLSDYQKKMKAERARRFGVDVNMPKP